MSEIMKKGFYKWNPTTKKFELIVQSEQNTWVLTNTFQDVEGKQNILYILSSDCIVDEKEYKKGFYTYDIELEDFVLQAGPSEVFTDVPSLPMSNIDRQTIYRISNNVWTHNGEEVDFLIGFRISDTENIQISETGITINGADEILWDNLTIIDLEEPIQNEQIHYTDISTPPDFAEYERGKYDIFTHFSYEIKCKLYHNPTETPDGYIKIGGGATDDVALKNPSEESLSEEARYQNQVNKEFKEKLRNIGEFVNVGNSFENVEKNEKYLYYLEEDWEPQDWPGLKFTSNEDSSTVGYTITGTVNKDIYYSTDGKTWTAWDGSNITLNNGQSIYIWNKNNTLSNSYEDTFTFTMSGSIAASGNCNSMINFGELSPFCYRFMFENCTSLTTPPDLPATTLAPYCYSGMFGGCSSLMKAPDLPATTFGGYCYSHMFNRCRSINTIKLLYIGDFDAFYFVYWVDGVSSSGTIYYNGSDTTRGVSAIPQGWTVEQFNQNGGD